MKLIDIMREQKEENLMVIKQKKRARELSKLIPNEIINKILQYNIHNVAEIMKNASKSNEIELYNIEGYNKRGLDRNGYDRNGYDRYGYDIDGECVDCSRHITVCRCF